MVMSSAYERCPVNIWRIQCSGAEREAFRELKPQYCLSKLIVVSHPSPAFRNRFAHGWILRCLCSSGFCECMSLNISVARVVYEGDVDLYKVLKFSGLCDRNLYNTDIARAGAKTYWSRWARRNMRTPSSVVGRSAVSNQL